MSPPGQGAGYPLNERFSRALFGFAQRLAMKCGVYDDDSAEVGQMVMFCLVEALARGTIRNTSYGGIMDWVQTTAVRKAIRYRGQQRKRVMRNEPKEQELDPHWIDGNDVIEAREQLRRVSREEIVQVLDYAYETPEQQRHVEYMRAKVVEKLSGKKKLSEHHWRNALPKKKKKKPPRRT